MNPEKPRNLKGPESAYEVGAVAEVAFLSLIKDEFAYDFYRSDGYGDLLLNKDSYKPIAFEIKACGTKHPIRLPLSQLNDYLGKIRYSENCPNMMYSIVRYTDSKIASDKEHEMSEIMMTKVNDISVIDIKVLQVLAELTPKKVQQAREYMRVKSKIPIGIKSSLVGDSSIALTFSHSFLDALFGYMKNNKDYKEFLALIGLEELITEEVKIDVDIEIPLQLAPMFIEKKKDVTVRVARFDEEGIDPMQMFDVGNKRVNLGAATTRHNNLNEAVKEAVQEDEEGYDPF